MKIDKKTVGLIFAPLIAILLYIAPYDIPISAKITLSIIVFCVILWLTEPIPVSITALIGVSIAVLTGVIDIKDAFSGFSNPVIILFIGSFLIAYAMSKHSVDRKIALRFLSNEIFLKNSISIIIGFSLISFLISMWISNTATTAMLLPMAIGVINLLKEKNVKGIKNFSAYILLTIAFGASIGGVATIVGSPTNIVGVGFLREEGYKITFLDWIKIAFPIAVFMYLIMILYTKFKIRNIEIDYQAVKNIIFSSKKESFNKTDIKIILTFGLAIFLWFLSAVVDIPESLVALLSASLLFILKDEEKNPILTAEDIKSVDWDTVLLFAGGLSLGNIISKSGLAKYIGEKISILFSKEDILLLLIFFIILTVLITEISSNTATVITFAPIVIAVLKEYNIDIFYPVLFVVFASSFAFMLPVATPPNAIVYGTKYIKLSQMIKFGLVLEIAGIVILSLLLILFIGV